MDRVDLSVLIPARNEDMLDRTIQDLLENIQGNTEIIVVLDGWIPDPPLTHADDRITIIYNPVAKGQRAATNQAAIIAKGKYVMKTDGHCAFDKGFDVKMMDAFKITGDNVTMIPAMRNLHAYDWVCENGHRRYQGKASVCPECGAKEHQDILWRPKPHSRFTYTFDKTMHFQYSSEEAKKPYSLRGVFLGWYLSFNPTMISSEIVSLLTRLANSHQLTCSSDSLWFRQNVSMNTVGFPSIDDSGCIGSTQVLGIGNQLQVEGITTSPILTEVVNNRDILTSTSGDTSDKPSISESMCTCFLTEISASSIPSSLFPSSPVPTARDLINTDTIKKINDVLDGRLIYNEKTNSLHNESITLIPVYDKNLRETMSIQGSCFMLTREKYFELDICSEDFHSWGQQGVEVACKTWLSGGRVISNLNTWYAHMFRTNNFGGFPYPNPESLVDINREFSRELFQRNKWPKAIHSFQWLLDRFKPNPYWDSEPHKGMIYYTDHELDEKIAKPVRDNLLKISQEKNIPIVTSALKRRSTLGIKNIYLPTAKRGYVTMFKQILAALENSTADIIFFTEHDVLYHPSHFDFVPPDKNTFYYNQNVWFLRPDGHAMHYDVNQVSGICVYRETAIIHYKERFERLQTEEFTRNMGFEPFTHNRVQWKNTFKCDTWKSLYPNIDFRVGTNPTGMRWKKDQYRNQQLLINWIETDDSIDGWGKTKDIVKIFS